ncbi:MAG: SIS domain-containing protein [Candidatus Neomarinimicrobiota bacterium]
MAGITLEEILSQPGVWQKALATLSDDHEVLQQYLHQSANLETVFIGCGTSYYLALSAARLYSLVTGQRSRASAASEVLFFPETIMPGNGHSCMPVMISRSGATTEIVRATEEIKSRVGDIVTGVSCRPESEMIRSCRFRFVIPAADEKSVVMTRSFTSMLLLIQYLAAVKSGNKGFEEALLRLPELGANIIDKYHGLIKMIFEGRGFTTFVYLGQGPYYGLACEAMLKIKEMSLSFSEAYHSLEFRHGPMSMVNENMLLIFLISERARMKETILLEEMKALGAQTLVLCETADPAIRAASDYLIELRSGLSDEARMILYMPAVQLLGYYNSIAKGLDPDNPKNLTQVVILN